MAPPAVMFLTFGRPLTPVARGILARCGLLVVERRTIEDAEHTLDDLWSPDCLVVDFHAVHGRNRPGTLDAVCTFVQAHITGRARSTRVIAATPWPLRGATAERCVALGIEVIATAHVSYRRIARAVLALLGNDGSACCPSASETVCRVARDERRRGVS